MTSIIQMAIQDGQNRASAEYNLWLAKEAKRHAEKFNFDRSTKATRLRGLAYAAYWAASTPTEAKMAGILIDLFGDEQLDERFEPHNPLRSVRT